MKSYKWILSGLVVLGASFFLSSCESAASDEENAQYLVGGYWIESDEDANGDYVENTLELEDEYFYLDHAVGDDNYSAYEGSETIGELTAEVTDETAAGALVFTDSKEIDVLGSEPLVANASLLDKTVNFEVEFVFFEDEPFVYIDSTYDDDGNFVVSDTFLISGVGTLNLDSWYTASSQSEFVTVIFADEPTEEEAGKAMPKNYFVEKNLPGKSVSFLTPKYMAKKHGLSKAKSEKAAAKTVRNIQKKLAH